jgi:hypothetical protein
MAFAMRRLKLLLSIGEGSFMRTLLTVDQLAGCLHKSVASIRSDATRNPRSLPPICRLPGTKRLLWRAEDVESWLAEHVDGVSTASSIKDNLEVQTRRGRPTKAEQVARKKKRTETLDPERVNAFARA